MGAPVRVILERKGAEVATVAPDAEVAEAVHVMTARGIGAVVVSADGSEVAGVLSERDVVRSLDERREDCLTQPVSSLMTGSVHTCTPSTSTDELMALMTEERIRHVPVVDDAGHLAGLVSIGDVVKWRIDELGAEREALGEYVSGSY
jgi:CBS domain-containing protein